MRNNNKQYLYPEQATRFHLDKRDNLDCMPSHVVHTFKNASLHYLDSVGWPRSFDMGFFYSQDFNWGESYQPPALGELFIRGQQYELSAARCAYDFNVQLHTSQGVVDAAEYRLAQFVHEGFMSEWSLAIVSISRVLLTKYGVRSRGILPEQLLTPQSCLSSLSRALLRITRTSTREQYEPVLKSAEFL